MSVSEVCQYVVKSTDLSHTQYKEKTKASYAFMAGRALFYIDEEIDIQELQSTIKEIVEGKTGQASISSFL